MGVRRGLHGGEVAVTDKDDKRRDERGDGLRVLADALQTKAGKSKPVDEIGLESRRRAIAYGRARGNA